MICDFDFKLFSESVTIVISGLNLFAIIIIFILECKRDKNVEKHKNIIKWYELFGLKEATDALLSSVELFYKQALGLLDKPEISSEIIKHKKSFSEERLKYKETFLDIVLTLDKKKVPLFTDKMNELDELSCNVVNTLTNIEIDSKAKNKELYSIHSKMKCNIIKTCSDLTSI